MGSSGGGGSTSGKTDFPDYMKKFHASFLDGSTYDVATGATTGGTTPTLSTVDMFNTAVSGYSPYHDYAAVTTGFAPSDAYVGTGKTLSDYAQILELLEVYQNSNLDGLIATYSSNTTTAELISSVSTALDDDIELDILPKFKSNLRSIGAVMSSSYVVGEALIWDSKIKALAKERLQIETVVNQNREIALKFAMAMIELRKGVVQTTADITKYFFALQTEIQDHYTSMASKDLRWDLDMAQYCNNTLSSISGSALSLGNADKGPSKVGSAIGGALSGAAVGAMAGAEIGGRAGGAWGAGIGAVAGAGASLLS